MQVAVMPSYSHMSERAAKTVDAVQAGDLQRALEACRLLRRELTRLAVYNRLLIGNEEPNSTLMADMLRLAAVPLTKAHPVILPHMQRQVALNVPKLPSAYARQSDFDAACVPRAKLLRMCLVLQQRLINGLYSRFPPEEVLPTRYQ